MPPIVDPDVLEKEAQKVINENPTITSRIVGGKTIFKGPLLKDEFDDYGECQKANEEEGRRRYNKAEGLDEWGRSPAASAMAKKKVELVKKKNLILEEARKIDIEISSLKLSDFEAKKKDASKNK